MNDELAFVDTNVLVYAHDPTAGAKHQAAKAFVKDLWESGAGCLSIQVLQEFYVTVTRKVPQPLSSAEAARLVADLSLWHVHAPSVPEVLEAIDRQQRYGLSFWDAMVITSAVELECKLLWSEDLSTGQIYDGVQVRDPFA